MIKEYSRVIVQFDGGQPNIGTVWPWARSCESQRLGFLKVKMDHAKTPITAHASRIRVVCDYWQHDLKDAVDDLYRIADAAKFEGSDLACETIKAAATVLKSFYKPEKEPPSTKQGL